MKEDLIHLRFKQAIFYKQHFAAIKLPNSQEVYYFYTSDTPQLKRVEYKKNDSPVFYISPYGAANKAYQFLPSTVYKNETLAFGQAFPEVTEHSQLSWNYKHFAPNFEADLSFYTNYVNQIKTAIIKKRVDKVVAARCESWPYESKTEFANEFLTACNNYPEACVYFFHLNDLGTWMGASPELLLNIDKTTINTVALAGTKINHENADWSEKEYEEQDMIAFFLEDVFNRIKPGKFSFTALQTVSAGKLNHLHSQLICHSSPAFLQTKFHKLLEAINPTPAVCGLPQFESSLFIGSHEQLERRFYTGFIGMQWPNGNLDLFVNLRCAELFKNKINFYAGAGISHLSNADNEFEETSHKINTIKSVFS